MSSQKFVIKNFNFFIFFFVISASQSFQPPTRMNRAMTSSSLVLLRNISDLLSFIPYFTFPFHASLLYTSIISTFLLLISFLPSANWKISSVNFPIPYFFTLSHIYIFRIYDTTRVTNTFISPSLSHCNSSTGRNDEHDSGGRFKTKVFTWTEKQGYKKIQAGGESTKVWAQAKSTKTKHSQCPKYDQDQNRQGKTRDLEAEVHGTNIIWQRGTGCYLY